MNDGLIDPMLEILEIGYNHGSTEVLIEANSDFLTADELVKIAASLSKDAKRLKLAEGRRVAVIADTTLSNAFHILCLSFLTSVVVLNPELPVKKLKELVKDASADGLLCDRTQRELASDIVTAPILMENGKIDMRSVIGKARGFEAGLVLMTSGSTGSPKRVPLRIDQLVQSAENIATTLELSPKDRAVSALPIFHVGALVDLLLASLLSGGSVVAAADKSPGALYDAVNLGNATWCQMVPTMLMRCLVDLAEADLMMMGASLRFVRMVSSDLAPDLQANAEKKFGGLPLIQMYGMTETAGQITSNPIKQPGRRLGSVGVAAGPEVSIMDTNGIRVGAQVVGEICVRGPTVMSGYEGEEETLRYKGGWLRSGDLGKFDEDGYLTITGRIKDMINRGGEKISPVSIERAALLCPDVQEAVAFGIPHKTLGQQVGLAIVGETATENQVQAHLATHLAEFEMPRKVSRLDTIPKLGSGKIDRQAVAALLQINADPDSRIVPSSKTERMLMQIWEKVLQDPLNSRRDDFFDAGGDSLSAAELLLSLEKRLHFQIPPNLLFEYPCFDDLANAIDQIKPSKDRQKISHAEKFVQAALARFEGERVGKSKLWVARNTDLQGIPVFFAVNGIKVAKSFSATLGKDRPHYIVRSLHKAGRRHKFSDGKLAKILADDILALRPHGRLVLGGVCRGASMLKRSADILRAKGRNVDLFICIDDIDQKEVYFPVIHIWTDSQWHSPFGMFENPDRGLALFNSAGAQWFHVPGNHGAALTAKALKPISNSILKAIDGADLNIPAPPKELGYESRRKRRRASITLRSRLIASRGSVLELHAKIRNSSSEIWPKTSKSGLSVFAAVTGWRRRIEWRKRLLGKRIPHEHLSAALLPGQSLDVDFQVTLPKTRGIYLVRVSMVDDGIAHFMNRFARAKRRLILVW